MTPAGRRPLRRALAAPAFLALAAGLQAFPTAVQIKIAFRALDASKNGSVSMDEWEGASFALFRAADKNGNDFIDLEELAGSGIAQDTFLRADLDRDGKLSIGEFMELRRAIFTRADIDRDDSLSFVEYELMILFEQVGWTDRNQNDHVDVSELRESLERAFKLLDADHDGKLSRAEAAYLRPDAFVQYDKDQDGFLSVEELVAGYRTELGG